MTQDLRHLREGWRRFEAGQQLVCPSCRSPLGLVACAYEIRVNPNGRFAPPTAGVPLSEACKACKVNLERREVRERAA